MKTPEPKTRPVKAQYADDLMVYACNSLVSNCTTVLREIDDSEKDIKELCRTITKTIMDGFTKSLEAA